MDSLSTLGWTSLVVLALGCGFLVGALLLHRHNRRQWVLSLQYVLDRLKVVESDLRRTGENELVLEELLKSRGLFDDEDLKQLRRELIERPRQIEAEREELIEQARDEDVAERMVKDVSDTIH